MQIIRDRDETGADIDIASLPPTSGPGLRTAEDKKAGVEGGFFTDVLHRDFGVTPNVDRKKGEAVGSYYQGGSPVFGFRRSGNPADIKAAETTDDPGTTNPKASRNFAFETVAKGDDNLLTYGALKWSFQIRKGVAQNDTAAVSDAASATYDAALKKHEEFYVHEPVTFYFDFRADTPAAGEADKIDGFTDYLRRFPDVRIDLQGFADSRGGAGAANTALGLRRAQSIRAALVARGVAATRINAPTSGGSTTSFTPDAGTPQDAEANRRGNRRVACTFVHSASTP